VDSPRVMDGQSTIVRVLNRDEFLTFQVSDGPSVGDGQSVL
jgi:hypothetical protein